MTAENARIDACSSRRTREIALWLAIVGILLAGIGCSWKPTPFAQGLAALFIACAFVHAAFLYGVRAAIVLFGTCVAVTFAVENLGVATGVPFGHYHFAVDAGLPCIGTFPMVVAPLWFGAGYFSWVVAAILLDGADRRLERPLDFIALPVVAAFVLTQWDLVMDRSESTIARVWVWHDGGADFGVPLTNYVGWLLTAWLVFQAFALYLRRRLARPGEGAPPSRKLGAIAILFYVSLGLTHIVPWVSSQSGEVVDAAGRAWQVGDLRGMTVAIMLFTMFFTSLLASLRLAKADQ
jgi:uncharacterized membrane protein